jgi:hypothetical protein
MKSHFTDPSSNPHLKPVPKLLKSGYRNQYSDFLQAGRPRGRSSSPRWFKTFLFSTPSRPPTHPPSIKCIAESLFPRSKRSEREANHLPPASVEAKKSWIYRSIPRCVFMALCLVKQRDNFIRVISRQKFPIQSEYQPARTLPVLTCDAFHV